MQDLVKKVNAFVTFELPLRAAYIRNQFADTQQKQQIEMPGWSTTATRQKLINNYWFNDVVRHFAFILGLPVLIIFISSDSFEQRNLLGVFMAGLLSFPILYLFLYRPNFGSTYLPRLETIKETFEQKQLEQLEKCRRAQLSNQALCLIYYVFDQACGINRLQPNEQYAGLLMKLYGVDQGSLKTNLELIMGSSTKRNSVSDRKRTEIKNRFTEAYQFFEELDFSRGIDLLKKMEAKFSINGNAFKNSL